MKTWMAIYCNAVLSSPFLRKNPSKHVTWMWWSLLLETKTTSWKHSEPRKRHCFASAIQDEVKHREMCFIHNHSNKWARPAQIDLSVETQKRQSTAYIALTISSKYRQCPTTIFYTPSVNTRYCAWERMKIHVCDPVLSTAFHVCL